MLVMGCIINFQIFIRKKKGIWVYSVYEHHRVSTDAQLGTWPPSVPL